ncbi:MAG: hypothetical protein ABSB40_03430 [Nitrososphaeria archaeon]|jgi:hypothetical protein
MLDYDGVLDLVFASREKSNDKEIQIQELCRCEFSMYRNAPMLLNMNQVVGELSAHYSIRVSNSEIVPIELPAGKRKSLTKTRSMVVYGVKSKEEAKDVYVEVMDLSGGLKSNM